MALIKKGDVSVDTDQLNRLAELFTDWSQDVDRLVPRAEEQKITPGWVVNGDALKKRYGDRVTTQYATLLKNLQASLFSIGTELVEIARGYLDTELENEDDHARLDGLIGAVKAVYTAKDKSTEPPTTKE